MANAEQYAQWIVDNQDKKGTEQFDIVAQAYRAAMAEMKAPKVEEKPQDISLGERIKDVGAGLVSGAGALAQLPGQLSGLAGLTELDDTGLQGAGKRLQKYGEEMKSAGLKAREQARAAKIKEAEKTGQLSAAGTAFAETIKDPALLMSFLAEQAPQLIVPFGAAKGAAAVTGAKALGRGLAAEEAALAAGKAGTKAAIGTGAVQQGADIGAGSYENIYKELIDQGANPDDAKQSALNLARASGASGALISLLAQKLPGASSMERAMAGVPGAGGRLAGAVTSGLGESFGEVAEETGGRFSQNLAMRSVKPEQSLTEGLGETAGMAAIGGVGMGGISGALQRQRQEPTARPTPEEELLALGMSTPFTPVRLPDGSVARTQEELDAFNAAQGNAKPLMIGMTPLFKPVDLPDGSVATTREEFEAYQEMARRSNGRLPILSESLIEGNVAGLPGGGAAASPAQLDAYRQQQQFGENLLAQPSTKAEQVEGLGEDEIEAKFSRYNQGLKAAKDLLRTGQITPERFNVLQDQYNRFRQEYDAYKERTAAPMNELQREASDIADKIELLGNKTLATAIRDSVKANKLDQGNVQFYNEKLAEMQARKAEEGQRIEETHGISQYSDSDKDTARFEAARKSENKDVRSAFMDADAHIQGLTDAINRYGYRVNAKDLPPQLVKLRGHIRSLAGIAHRLAMENEATSKGFKRSTPEKLARAIAETNADIAKAKQLIAEASVEKNELVEPPEVTQANKDIAAAEMGVRKVKRESMSLWTALTGKLAASEVRDIFSKRPTFGQRALQTERGGQVSDLVADGYLDDYLPPHMRHDSADFDEVASTEYIKDKLRDQNYVTFEAETEIKQLFNSIAEAEELIREHLTAEEANKLIQEALDEQDEAGRTAEEIVTRGATGAPEAVSTQDLATQATGLGIDVDSIAEDVARRSEGLTQDQYNGELRKALESAIKSEQGQQMVEMRSAEKKAKGYNATKEGQQMEKDLTGKSIFQAAQYLIDKAPNAFYKYVGTKILEKLNKMQSEGVMLNFKIDGGKSRLNHMYRANGKTQMVFAKDGSPMSFNVILNGEPVIPDQPTHPSGMEYKTLMHELLHVATQAELHFLNFQDANHPAVREMIRLYNKVAAEYKAQRAAGTLPDFLKDFDAGKNNALESPDELLTWSMTDERMQKWMSNIKVGDKTLMDKIVELIRNVLGISKPYETALDRLVRTTDQIIDIESSVTADGVKKAGYSYGPSEAKKRMPKEQQSLFSRAAQQMMESELRLGKQEEQPTPTGAGKDSMEILSQLGRANQEAEPGYREKVRQAWDNARDNPKATAEAARQATTNWMDKFETWTFSSDAALNNRIVRALKQMGKDSAEKLGMLLNASLSQTVHSDAVASLFLQKGNIRYNNELHKWEGVDDKANFVTLSKQLDALAKKNGLTKQQAELVAHTAFEAKRLRSLVRFNEELDQKVANLRAEAQSKRASSPVASSALNEKAANMEKLRKYISPSQLAMIEPGMKLFKIHPELNEVVKTWNDIRENAVKIMVDTGLWSKNDAEEMLSNADYVPFYREEQLEQNKGPKEFIRGLRVQAREHRIKGSDRPVNDIFDNQVRWVQYSINRAVRNRSAVALADTAEEVGAAKRIKDFDNKENVGVVGFDENKKPILGKVTDGAKPFSNVQQAAIANRDLEGFEIAEYEDENGKTKYLLTPKVERANVVKVWKNGNEVEYSMDDPMFMDAFTGLEAIVIPSWKWASSLANMLRQSVVMYPLFSVAQVPQDSFAAMFSSGLKPQFALRIPVLAVKEFVQTLRGASRTHEELKNVGAVGVRDFTSAMVRMDAEIYAGLKAPPGVLGKVKHALNHIAMSADNAVRQAVYEASMAQGLSRAEAMEKAFDVFNVRRKGSSKSLALAGQMIPFFSAYLAAQNVAYKTITGRGISPTERQDAFKTLAATTASVMVLSLLYAMMNGDDDDYLKKPATQRDRLLMVPGTGGFSIPLRADLFTMPKIITEHTYLMMTDKGYEDGRKFRDSMNAALGSALLSPTVVPQAIKPLVEVGINYDFFQGRPLIGTYQQKLETERQFTDSTSEMAKILGSTGIASPIAIDHLIRGMFGSVGGLVLYATNPMLHSDPNSPRPSLSERDAIAALPGMSGLMTKSYESALKKDFYTLKEEVDKAANTMNDLKTRSPQDIEGFVAKEENVARLGLQKSVNKIGEELSKIRKATAVISNSGMSSDEKREQIKALREAEESLLQGVDVKTLRALGKI